MTAESTQTSPRSRRALLAGALGGLAAWTAAAAARVDPAAAAAGDPIRIGRLNRAEGTSTTLQTSDSKPAFNVRQLGGGSAVRAEAASGRAIMATVEANGTAVWAFSPNHFGVLSDCPNGVAVNATSQLGKGVLADGGEYGVEAHGGTAGLVASGGDYAADLRGHLALEGYQDLHWNVTEPLPPSGLDARLFARPIGSTGKTELCVKFHTGAVQVIASEL